MASSRRKGRWVGTEGGIFKRWEGPTTDMSSEDQAARRQEINRYFLATESVDWCRKIREWAGKELEPFAVEYGNRNGEINAHWCVRVENKAARYSLQKTAPERAHDVLTIYNHADNLMQNAEQGGKAAMRSAIYEGYLLGLAIARLASRKFESRVVSARRVSHANANNARQRALLSPEQRQKVIEAIDNRHEGVSIREAVKQTRTKLVVGTFPKLPQIEISADTIRKWYDNRSR